MLSSSLFFWISHRLSQNNFLIIAKFHGFCQRFPVNRSSDNGGQTFGGAEQINIFAYKTRVRGRVENFLFIRYASHLFEMGYINQRHRRVGDK